MTQAALALERESGIRQEHPSLAAFRRHTLAGSWREAQRALLEGLSATTRTLLPTSAPTQSVPPPGPTSSPLAPAAPAPIIQAPATDGPDTAEQLAPVLRAGRNGWSHIKFLLLRQRYLELLEAGRVPKALTLLRTRLAPLCLPSELQRLSSLVFARGVHDLRSRASWPGAGVASRQALLASIVDEVNPDVLLPLNRLQTLLNQAQEYEVGNDLYYNQPRGNAAPDHSLLLAWHADRACFPEVCTQVLRPPNRDEVYTLAWSPNGHHLAAAGVDGTISVWTFKTDVEDKNQFLLSSATHTILRLSADSRAEGPIYSLVWSPDGLTLFATTEHDVVVWTFEDPENPQQVSEPNTLTRYHFDYRITSCAVRPILPVQTRSGPSVPRRATLVTASEDRSVVFYLPDGSAETIWDTAPARPLDVDISPDGRYMALASFNYKPGSKPRSNPLPTDRL